MIPRTNDRFHVTWTRDAHFRVATCKEVQCPHYINGWITRVIIGSPQDQYIRKDKSRKSVGVQVSASEIEYYYEEGQKCFRPHRVKVERAPFFTVNQPGKETPRLVRANMDFDEWTDKFNESSYRATRR